MARLPLNTLPAFRAVAQLQNLRAAAEELNLTHSAVSQQIKLLEGQIGFELFDRRGRRVVLNAAGSALLATVGPALGLIDDGLRAAAAAAQGAAQRIRVTVVPSFAQRWLLPRMGSWRDHHPDIGIELHASQHMADLQREGFHAALRQGTGPWRGLQSERLIDSPLIAVGSPDAARRLAGRETASLNSEPLLGDGTLWERWFALDGCRDPVRPVASFNDAGLMLQAAEQGIGIALARELLAADALRDGRLARLSPLSLPDDAAQALWLAYPPELAQWTPMVALREWLQAELRRSWRGLGAASRVVPPGTVPAGGTGSRSRAMSAERAVAKKASPRPSR